MESSKRQMIPITKNALLWCVLCLFFLAGFLFFNPIPLGFGLLLFFYLASGMFINSQVPKLTFSRELSQTRTTHGQMIEACLKVTNHGSALEEVWIQDQIHENLKIVEGDHEVLTSLAAGETLELHYTIYAHRGIYPLNQVKVTAYDALGAMEQEHFFTLVGGLLVLPKIRRIKSIPFSPQKILPYTGPYLSRVRGSGTQFFDVREYRTGDSLRHINWRACARNPHLIFTNEFEQERVADITLILDTRINAYPLNSEIRGLDSSVEAVAMLAEGYLRAGNRVSLLVYGDLLKWIFPGYGKLQQEKIFQALAAAEEGTHQIFSKLDRIPIEFFPVRSQLIVVSPLLFQDISAFTRLRAKNFPLVVISPDIIDLEKVEDDPNLSEEENQRVLDQALRIRYLERRVLIHDLEARGIFVIDWKIHQSIDLVMNAHWHKINTWQRHAKRF